MKRQLFLLILVALFLAVPAFAGEARTYGKGITLTETSKVSEILEHPEAFIGKTVKVRGTVVEVCPKRGCWIELASDRPFEKIQVKVTDGEIVFPMEARGRQATVEGVVQELKLSKEQVIGWKRHLAEEKGETFDPSTVTGGETVYRIRGLGAAIDQ
ncbi:MAG: hypothetical protein C0617_04830 [Desulfuromonas sp.]|uniref:DUF4920 domain-containing protein n=1 Tax=Desulfuromonas sp. TaxID=892 RepID=UPI000CC8DA9F|nr:DUF4920 domain-containing protein [Desulfuromonas sp.]PLX85395.1 MAG: hypothetical protein C0617_04830 [Desulfuromonas sp.]